MDHKRHTVSAATAATRNLFRLYDFVQSGDIESVDRHLASGSITHRELNSVLPGKGVGILHLTVGMEPIHVSARCTEILLKYGADPNLCSDDGMTPVHVAAIWGRLDNLRLLMACGGDSTRSDDYGLMAYQYADIEGQYDVLEYLRRNGGRCEEAMSEQDPCRYSLQLERVLVSTGHIVAEYAPVSDEMVKDISACRKSDMVRAWCEQTSRVNRLYPTILNHTYRIEDEYKPWKIEDFTKPETDASFKSCESEGTNPRSEDNPDCDCSCHSETSVTDTPRNDGRTEKDSERIDTPTRRVSVYENFSLPGSPTNIIHVNYHNRTNLKKSKSNNSSRRSSLIKCRQKCTFYKNKRKSRRKSDLKKINEAVATIQNETNEWLSQSNSSVESDGHYANHRQEMIEDHRQENDVPREKNGDLVDLEECMEELSIAERSLIEAVSRSSGVSSVSSGSVALASVTEEYKYRDDDEDVVFIEKRLLVPSVVVAMEASVAEEVSPEASRHSMASSLPASIDYDAGRLRAELTARGFTPGPINDTTKRLYLRKLKNLKKNPIVVTTQQGKTYSIELERSLRDPTWCDDLSAHAALETRAREDFANPKNSRMWREGNTKTSFTYLLLDPRLTDNLPARAASHTQHDNWRTFVGAIFYVGKGKRSRPYSHLYQALTLWKKDFRTSTDKKVQQILDIWAGSVGVVCLHVFQNVIPAEAYTHEAAMIDVIGVNNLTNQKVGNYYGVASGWALRERRMLGLYLLHRAMLIFLSEGERQLRPGDID